MNKFLIAVFLLALVVVPTLSARHGLTSARKASLEKLKHKGTWASFLINLAEVHLTTGGPLDELIETIGEVVTDLQNKLQKAHENFDTRTELHESEVRRIQDLIDSADSDIATTIEFLAVLDLQKEALESEIVNTEASIEANIKATQEAIALRALQHAEFAAKVPEHESAIAALEEALSVLSQLHDYEGAASFAQVKKFQKNMDTINNKMQKGQDKSFLNALVDLAMKTAFADSEAVAKVEKIMNDVKNNLIASLAQFRDDEEREVAEHAEDLHNKSAELNSLNINLVELREAVAETEARIADNEEFLNQRRADKVAREQDLQDENDAYERARVAYEDLVAQFQNELSACQQALDHLENSEIADFIGDRMEMDVVIDQQHGSGITVEKDPYDLE